MWEYRVTVRLPGYAPVSKRYASLEKTIKNVAKVIDHPSAPTITIEPVLITEPGA